MGDLSGDGKSSSPKSKQADQLKIFSSNVDTVVPSEVGKARSGVVLMSIVGVGSTVTFIVRVSETNYKSNQHDMVLMCVPSSDPAAS